MDRIDNEEVSIKDSNVEHNKKVTYIIYGLYFASLFLGVTAIVALIANYIKRGSVQGTYLESHFTWQIKTFWWSLILYVVSVLTLAVGIGFLFLIGTSIWFIYRIVKGFVYLNDEKAMYQEYQNGMS